MLIHEIGDAPSTGIQTALAIYESKFVYELGEGRQFRVDYGADRTQFIRTLGGEWRIFAAEQEGHIMGTIEMAMRDLLAPNGAAHPSVFLTEVRLLPEARRRTAAGRLLKRAAEWSAQRAKLKYCVANDSTPVKPTDYTGRLGIPLQSAIARLALIRVPLQGGAPAHGRVVPKEEGVAEYGRLAAGFYRFAPAEVSARSSVEPKWLVHARRTACGRVEDRRRVMRLVETGGRELAPAFLSCFAYSDPADGRELLAHACALAAEMGYGALRGCVTERQLTELRATGGEPIPAAGAAIYGTPLEGLDADWIINAAEM